MSGIKVLALFGQLKHSRIDNEQTETLALELVGDDGILYRKKIFFNAFINLPSFILFIIPVWLLIKYMDDFRDVDECDVIVVSGKKMIRFARHLRHYMFPNTKIVQIGNPMCKIRKNDILIRQETSRFIYDGKNTIKVNGLICGKIKDDLGEEQSLKFEGIKRALKGEYIGVFLGKNKYLYKLTVANAIKFGRIISEISNNMKMPLLIATDGKIDAESIHYLKENLNCSYYFYEKQKDNNKNPKVAFMYWSKYYILCGNSINDQSEYIAQNIPTYVYIMPENKKRYLRFINIAIERNSVRVLSDKDKVLKDFVPNSMNNLQKISKQIKELL